MHRALHRHGKPCPAPHTRLRAQRRISSERQGAHEAAAPQKAIILSVPRMLHGRRRQLGGGQLGGPDAQQFAHAAPRPRRGILPAEARALWARQPRRDRQVRGYPKSAPFEGGGHVLAEHTALCSRSPCICATLIMPSGPRHAVSTPACWLPHHSLQGCAALWPGPWDEHLTLLGLV